MYTLGVTVAFATFGEEEGEVIFVVGGVGFVVVGVCVVAVVIVWLTKEDEDTGVAVANVWPSKEDVAASTAEDEVSKLGDTDALTNDDKVDNELVDVVAVVVV